MTDNDNLWIYLEGKYEGTCLVALNQKLGHSAVVHALSRSIIVLKSLGARHAHLFLFRLCVSWWSARSSMALKATRVKEGH